MFAQDLIAKFVEGENGTYAYIIFFSSEKCRQEVSNG
jgi:hypothetical protein